MAGPCRGDRGALRGCVGSLGMRLGTLATIVRSKNAGPTRLTVDVLFDSAAAFARGASALTADTIAARYGRAAGEVAVHAVPEALAIKVVMPRARPAGGPFDRDVYGAQQHGPLLDLDV